MTSLSEALRDLAERLDGDAADRFVIEQAADALENTDLSRGGDSPRQHRTQAGEEPATTPYATLDAEAEALMQEWAGDEANLDWQNITANGRIEWRRVAQKAREMHRKTASMKECVRVYGHSIGTPRDCLRAVLQHLGVEVTP